MDLLQNLPKDIGLTILEYIKYPYPYIPASGLIRDELYMYSIDHSIYHSRLSKKYFIKSILPFTEYYFDKFVHPYRYLRQTEEE